MAEEKMCKLFKEVIGRLMESYVKVSTKESIEFESLLEKFDDNLQLR